MIALIPAETGKPVARLEKAPVVDGTCTWADPIYEMVKLVKNQKTETYKEKIYYFNVQTVIVTTSYISFLMNLSIALCNVGWVFTGIVKIRVRRRSWS